MAAEASASIARETYRNYGDLGKRKLPFTPMGLANITQWIHLSDAVERGSIHPLEAWDTIAMGYVAEHLKVRDSRYKEKF